MDKSALQMTPMELMDEVRQMCHKERKMGTMVERIQHVTPVNFLSNMVRMFANMGNALTPSHLRAPFAWCPS